jgi:phage shock protein PspC (stress-responsive transcriptional regulator)
MKKTVKITIKGFSYHLDEDAYQALNDYLQAIGKQFASNEESKEIVEEVECRIAEIFTDWTNDQKQVITLDDIHRLIKIIGEPNDFASGEEEETKEPTTSNTNENGKVYRDKDNAVFGGVCSGLGNYFAIDPLLLRLLFVILVLFYGLSLWAYIILWIVIPAAITPEQKMTMKSRKYKQGKWKQKVSGEFKDIKNGPAYRGASDMASNVGKGLAEVVHVIFRVLAVLIGVALLISGMAILIGFISAFIFAEPLSISFFPDVDSFRAFAELFVRPTSLTLISVTAFLVIILPVLALIYWGLKLILRFQTQGNTLWIVGLTTWVLSLIILVGTSMYEARNYAFALEQDGSAIIEPAPDTLYIKTKELANTRVINYEFFDADIEYVKSDEFPNRIFWETRIDFRKSTSDELRVSWEKTIRGYQRNSQKDENSHIGYDWEMKGDTLFLPAHFYTEDLPAYRIPEYDVEIEIPENQVIHMDESVESQIGYIRTTEYISRYSMGGKMWKMQEEGLTELEKK